MGCWAVPVNGHPPMCSPWPPGASGAGAADGRPRVDLSGIRAQSAYMANTRSTTLMRTLHAQGRLPLPVDAGAATKLPAERDGALVIVYLPGSPDQPRPTYATNALPLEARGRLTVPAGVHREAGNADVLAVLDPDRRTVTFTAPLDLQPRQCGGESQRRDRTGQRCGVLASGRTPGSRAAAPLLVERRRSRPKAGDGQAPSRSSWHTAPRPRLAALARVLVRGSTPSLPRPPASLRVPQAAVQQGQGVRPAPSHHLLNAAGLQEPASTPGGTHPPPARGSSAVSGSAAL